MHTRSPSRQLARHESDVVGVVVEQGEGAAEIGLPHAEVLPVEPFSQLLLLVASEVHDHPHDLVDGGMADVAVALAHHGLDGLGVERGGELAVARVEDVSSEHFAGLASPMRG